MYEKFTRSAPYDIDIVYWTVTVSLTGDPELVQHGVNTGFD